MSRSENRHYSEVWANKKHPASKCRKAKCTICHAGKDCWNKIIKR